MVIDCKSIWRMTGIALSATYKIPAAASSARPPGNRNLASWLSPSSLAPCAAEPRSGSRPPADAFADNPGVSNLPAIVSTGGAHRQATVVIAPAPKSMRRIAWLAESETYKCPFDASKAKPRGKRKGAEPASTIPPAAVEVSAPALPKVPAKVLMMPEPRSTTRTAWLAVSAMKRSLREESIATSLGLLKSASELRPPSPEAPAFPKTPAIVTMVPRTKSTSRTA
mmetsp:Transcript_111224/g.321573  ORF Transcript_111224/g.321573 Transcript_111224/m.321573 type:complete len:225 (+) Transcript_111224:262-936(+)